MTGQQKRINISLLVPFLVMALVFGLLLWKKYRDSQQVPPGPQVQETAKQQTAVLFFVADGVRLGREARELEPCSTPDDCLQQVLTELFNGPVGDLDDPVAEGTVLNGARIEGDTAVVDVNPAFFDNLPSGSSAEMMAVYSVVDSIGFNFPKIRQVRFLVDGGRAMGRHLDLSEPLEPDFTLEQPEPGKQGAEPAAPPGRR